MDLNLKKKEQSIKSKGSTTKSQNPKGKNVHVESSKTTSTSRKPVGTKAISVVTSKPKSTPTKETQTSRKPKSESSKKPAPKKESKKPVSKESSEKKGKNMTQSKKGSASTSTSTSKKRKQKGGSWEYSSHDIDRITCSRNPITDMGTIISGSPFSSVPTGSSSGFDDILASVPRPTYSIMNQHLPNFGHMPMNVNFPDYAKDFVPPMQMGNQFLNLKQV